MKKSPIEELVKALKADKGYRLSWQYGIALAFKDEYILSKKKYLSRHRLHDISMQAANQFLCNLCRLPEG